MVLPREIQAMRRTVIALGVLLLATVVPAQAQNTKFDGAWKVTLTCPPHNDHEGTKGYTHVFPAEVKNGQLQGVHGQEGEPGWHLLQGKISPDGNATLMLDGIVNSPDHAIGRGPKGKPYSYKVRAKFEQTSGTGQRTGGRVCEFRFAR
jgi:hypothetical protein